MRDWRTGARALAAAFLAAGILFSVLPATPAAASGGATAVIEAAEAKLGDPWVFGATGPNAFDCAGLVYYAFRSTGNLAAIGGTYKNATALYSYFLARGRASTSGGRAGDLVVFGGGTHIGIYLGDGRVISTLLAGVQIASLWSITPRFTAFLHTGLSGYASVPLPPTRAAAPRPQAAAPRPTPRVSASLDLGVAVDPDVVISQANLNVRARPTVTSPVLGLVGTGASLAVSRAATPPDGVWFLVRTTKGLVGWVTAALTVDPTPLMLFDRWRAQPV